MTDQDFYAKLTAFTDFRQVAQPQFYQALPESWSVIITDIKGSTKAIEAGRYKDVNLLGAATIIAILNMDRSLDLPYIFGGDGATLLIPSSMEAQARQVLLATKALSQREFGLELRAGIIPYGEIKRRGSEIRVAKYKLSAHIDQAMFSGAGIMLAETLVKDPATQAQFEVMASNGDSVPSTFEGLECRWQPIQSDKGRMVSLLVVPNPKASRPAADIISEVLRETSNIFGTFAATAPMQKNQLSLSLNPFKLLSEAKIRAPQSSRWSYLFFTLLSSLLGKVMIALNLKNSGFDGAQYMTELVQNTDSKKYDQTLRVILDATAEQMEHLQNVLKDYHQKNLIYYGLHSSPRALITCLVFNRHGKHVHFMDVDEGGYAMAAKGLKAQLKK